NLGNERIIAERERQELAIELSRMFPLSTNNY
ncbi:unnamed protein product, partial [Rotaria sp. Silwood1]